MGRREKSLPRDPGFDLLGGRENRRAKIVHGMEKKKRKKKETFPLQRGYKE